MTRILLEALAALTLLAGAVLALVIIWSLI